MKAAITNFSRKTRYKINMGILYIPIPCNFKQQKEHFNMALNGKFADDSNFQEKGKVIFVEINVPEKGYIYYLLYLYTFNQEIPGKVVILEHLL